MEKFLNRIKGFNGISLIDRDSIIDYGEFVDQIVDLSEILYKSNLNIHDVVCFVAEKNINTIILFMALVYSNISCCPVNAEEINMPPHTALIKKSIDYSHSSQFQIRNEYYDIEKKGSVADEYSKSVKGKYLNSTSGSTGNKKYALASWNNIYENAKSVCKEYNHNEKLVYMSLFSADMHICESFMRSLFCGGTAVLVENTDAEMVARLITEKRVNHIECVPSQLLAIKESLYGLNTNQKIVIECAGGLLSIKAEGTIQKLFPKARIIRSWGSAEGSGICLSTYNSSINEQNSLGKVINGYEATVDENGQMHLKGEGVVTALYDNGKIIKYTDSYSTGDLVKRDKEGNFYILGRVSNMIKCAGENIYPTTIEEALYKHNDIEDCVVIGVPDDFRGEKVVAWITIYSDMLLPTERELKQFCQKILIKNQLIPKKMHITYDKIPQNKSGKIDIAKVRDFFIGGNVCV